MLLRLMSIDIITRNDKCINIQIDESFEYLSFFKTLKPLRD